MENQRHPKKLDIFSGYQATRVSGAGPLPE